VAVFGTPSTIFGSKPSEASTTNIFAPTPAKAIETGIIVLIDQVASVVFFHKKH
jgi:hypothetical protein